MIILEKYTGEGLRLFYSNQFDSHVHSDCSPEGRDPVMALCEQAVRKGLAGIAITDRCDFDRYAEKQFGERVRASVYSVYKARAAFGDSLTLSCGVELSQPLAAPEHAEKIAALHPFDLVLASVKTFADGTRPSRMRDSELSEEELSSLFAGYFEQMRRTVLWGKFDVLSQLTFPMRYFARDDAEEVFLRPREDLIEEILRLAAEKGIALEINTSSLRTRAHSVQPPARYVRRFRELGGELITIGSGAYEARTLGADLSEGMDRAREAGYRYFTYYINRRPQPVELN